MWRRRSLTHPEGTFLRMCQCALVVPKAGACSASHELPSSCNAPNTCTVHVVIYTRGSDGAHAPTAPMDRGAGCDVLFEVLLTFLPCASARADGVVRAPVSAACVLALRTRFGTLTTRSAPRACAAATLGNPYTFDGMRTLLRRKCRLKSPIQVRHVLLRQTPPVARGIRLRCRHAREII